MLKEKAEEDDNIIGEVAQRKRELDRAKVVMGESVVSAVSAKNQACSGVASNHMS